MIVKSHDKLKKSLFGPEKLPLEKIEFDQRGAMIFIENDRSSRLQQEL